MQSDLKNRFFAGMNRNDEKLKKAMEKFAADLNKESDDDDGIAAFTRDSRKDVVNDKISTHIVTDQNGRGANDSDDLCVAEKELLKEELQKTEEEIATLRQVIIAREKHAAEIRRKLGISPLSEITSDISHSLQQMKESQAYQKTSEVVTETAETVKHKWNDMRNSTFFKSFESKFGSAYNNAKMVASTSIDHLSGNANKPSKDGTTLVTPSNDKPPLA